MGNLVYLIDLVFNKKSAHDPSGQHCLSLSRKHEVTKSNATSPGWNANPLHVTPNILSGFPDSSLVPIYTPISQSDNNSMKHGSNS